MHIHVLDQYQRGDSPVHRLDPRVKLLMVLAYILACALTPSGAWLAYAGLAVLWLVAVLLSDVPPSLLLRRGLLALPFALVAATVLFTVPGEPLLSVTVPVFNWQLTVTDAGLIRFLSIMLKSWLSVLMALLLVATTTFPDLMHGLRGIGVPAVLVAVIGFMYRYIFVLADEVLRLLRARESRMAMGPPGQRTGGSVAWRAKVAGGMVGSLFVRTLARSDRVYQAMTSRGYAGELRWLDKPQLRSSDVFMAGFFVVTLILIELLARVMTA